LEKEAIFVDDVSSLAAEIYKEGTFHNIFVRDVTNQNLWIIVFCVLNFSMINQ